MEKVGGDLFCFWDSMEKHNSEEPALIEGYGIIALLYSIASEVFDHQHWGSCVGSQLNGKESLECISGGCDL